MMHSIINFLQRLAGIKKNEPFEIRFYKEAIYFGEHGQICVSNRRHELVETPVRFVLVGITTPPKMDLYLFTRIWDEAKIQGYIPHHIVTYGVMNDTIDLSVPYDVTAKEVIAHASSKHPRESNERLHAVPVASRSMSKEMVYSPMAKERAL